MYWLLFCLTDSKNKTKNAAQREWEKVVCVCSSGDASWVFATAALVVVISMDGHVLMLFLITFV